MYKEIGAFTVHYSLDFRSPRHSLVSLSVGAGAHTTEIPANVSPAEQDSTDTT